MFPIREKLWTLKCYSDLNDWHKIPTTTEALVYESPTGHWSLFLAEQKYCLKPLKPPTEIKDKEEDG